MLVCFMTIWNILWPFGISCGRLVEFVVICYIFPNLECLDQEKSGNPDYSTAPLLSIFAAFAKKPSKWKSVQNRLHLEQHLQNLHNALSDMTGCQVDFVQFTGRLWGLP
jgi:hypothetical protein